MVFQYGNVDDTFKSIVVPLREMISADQQSLRVIFNWATDWIIEYDKGDYTVLFTNEISWNRLLWIINIERMKMINA